MKDINEQTTQELGLTRFRDRIAIKTIQFGLAGLLGTAVAGANCAGIKQINPRDLGANPKISECSHGEKIISCNTTDGRKWGLADVFGDGLVDFAGLYSKEGKPLLVFSRKFDYAGFPTDYFGVTYMDGVNFKDPIYQSGFVLSEIQGIFDAHTQR